MSDAAFGGGGTLGPRAAMAQVRWALVVQWRVLAATFLREAGVRRGQSIAFGWLLGTIEPLMIIAAIGALLTLTSREPEYGSSNLLFIGTGVFPMYIVIFTSIRVREPMSLINHGRYPLEMPLDEILVHAFLHMISTLIVAVAFFTALALYGVHDAVPSNVGTLFASTGVLFLLGIGLGAVNAAIIRLFPLWAILWSGFVRALFHFSGLYLVVDRFPPNVRQYFAINPLTHGLNWFRHAFYPFYSDAVTDRGYVLFWAVAMLTIGLALERVLRREYRRGERPL
jgi:capsular polysaccharide transport system permease protein